MTLQKKEIATAAKDPVDEIDEIMNEIEELQQSMAATQPAVPTQASAPPKVALPAVTFEEEADVMGEFKGGTDEVSMEETLGDLKDDEPNSPNLIDQAMESEAVRETILAVAEKHDDLLDAAEAEALDDAIADEEAEALQEIVTEEEIMTEAPRRSRPDHSDSAESSVSIRLSGEMTLRLSYEYEGQEVTIGFDDGALRVELSDGTEFKIPVRRTGLRKVG